MEINIDECQCCACRIQRKRDEAIKNQDINALISVIDEIEKLRHNEEAYYKGILKGTWPDAEKHLTNGLERAKNVKLEKDKAEQKYSHSCAKKK